MPSASNPSLLYAIPLIDASLIAIAYDITAPPNCKVQLPKIEGQQFQSTLILRTGLGSRCDLTASGLGHAPTGAHVGSVSTRQLDTFRTRPSTRRTMQADAENLQR